ncbi:MAG: hypothetical protein WCH58_04535 [Candidatus Saccharibacteria bacterium]
MMNDELFLNEYVKVVATFGDGLNPCQPLKFKRKNGREVIITEIGLRFPNAKGNKMVHIFDVTDGSADYRLEFDAERLTWRLTREADHEI